MSYGEDFIKAILGVRDQAQASLPDIQAEIADIIGSKENSTKRIEHLLDRLLDFTRVGIGDNEFKELNDYYATANKENSKEYAGFYQEALES